MKEDYEEVNETYDTSAEATNTSTESIENGSKSYGYSPCYCCRSSNISCCDPGELIKNGGMEYILNNRPRHWTFINSSGVSSENTSGNVHTGNASVTINSGSGIEQRIDHIRDYVVYNFSFFAKGLTSAVGLTATVIFITCFCQIEGAEITIRAMDMINDGRGYDYYRTLTTMAPRGTIAALIRFTANGATGQRVNIDDVSFSAK